MSGAKRVLAPKSGSVIIEVDSYADDPERWAADNRTGPGALDQ